MLAHVQTAKNRENLALFLICALVLLRNFALMIEGFGEQDAARLFNDAIIWSKTGVLDPALTQYRARISPLYIYALKRSVDLGADYGTIVYAMNAASAVAGALTFAAAFSFFRHFLPFGGMILGAAVLAFAPSAFLASIYGMPHTIGFFFFMCALAAFAAAHLGPKRNRARMRWIGVPCLCLAAAIKADLLLCSGAFLGVLYCARRTGFTDLARAGLWIAAAALTPLVLHAVWVPEAGSATQALSYASQWNSKYATGLENLFSPQNIVITALFAGPVFLGLFPLALAVAWRSPEGRKIAVLALLWAMPVLLFWGLREGNSARHLMPAAVPLALVLAWAGTRLPVSNLGRAGVALAALAANYVWIPPLGNTVAPSTQILNSTAALQSQVDFMMIQGRKIETSDARDHVLVGSGILPYMVFNALRNAEAVAIEEDGLRIAPRGGGAFMLRQRYVRDAEAAHKAIQTAQAQGRRVWSPRFKPGDLARAE